MAMEILSDPAVIAAIAGLLSALAAYLASRSVAVTTKADDVNRVAIAEQNVILTRLENVITAETARKAVVLEAVSVPQGTWSDAAKAAWNLEVQKTVGVVRIDSVTDTPTAHSISYTVIK